MGKDLFNDRISRFSIRKLNVGVCSVLLGTLVMVGTAASAAAEEKTDFNYLVWRIFLKYKQKKPRGIRGFS